MKNSKLIFILALMLMIISVGGVSAADDGDIAVSDVAGSFDDGLNLQTVAVSDQALESEIVTSGDGDNSTPQTWEVDDSNYDTYFDLNDDYYPGIIKADAPIKSGDTLKLGNLTSKILYIDRTLTITSMSEDSVMTNCMIQLAAGSDNSVVSGLHIYIDYAQIPDISTQLFCLAVTDVNNITVINNLFENGGKKAAGKGGSYAMAIANVTNSLFTKNTIHSFIVLDNGSKQGGDTAIQIVYSSNNVISYNDIETNGANCIYFVPSSISGIWSLPSDVTNCAINNIIEYNTLNANSRPTNAMAWICQHYAGADNNTYRFNVICNGGIGITSSGGKGEICYNNTIYNVGTGIAAVNNFTVYNNVINATGTGITAGGSAQIYNNIINVNAATGMGISVSGAMDGCLVKDNQIFVTANKSATGIKVTGQKTVNGIISGNTIEVYDDANASVGINIGTTVDTAAGVISGVTVSNNKITAQKIGIILNKTTDSTFDGNIINLLNDDEAYGIYVACSKATTAVAPNSTNNVISNNRINAKTGIKVGDATSKKAITGLEISKNTIVSDVIAIDISGDVAAISDVNICNNDITVNATADKEAYAIFVNKVNNLTISGNTIDFTANTDGTVVQYVVSLAAIEGLVFDSNKVDAKLPSLPVSYDPTTWAAVYSDLGFYLVDSNNAIINKNTFTVVDTKEGTGYDTLCNVYLKGDSNIAFTNNDVSVLASVYGYAVKAEGYYVFDDDYEIVYINSTNVNIANNNIKSTSTGYQATGLELGSPLDATISNNEIQVNAVNVAYAINAAAYNGPVNLIINNNKITGTANSIYGVELYGCNEVTVLINKINLNGNYTMGIASSSDVIEIMGNEIIAKGANLGTPTLGDGFGSDNIGIYVNKYANKALISSNKISSSKYGIVADCAEANIIENVIDVVGIAGNDTIGVKTSTKTNLIGNTITANGEQTYCELDLPVNTITGVLATTSAKVTAFNNKITTNGNYSIDLTDSCKDGFTQNTISSNYLVANKLVGDDSVTYYEGCEANNFISDNTPIIVVITASNVVKTYKDSTKLTITLKDNHGKVIAGKSISITIGKSSYTVTTDKNGKATLTLNQAVGSYSATIKVSGTNYITASKKVSIKVNKAATTVTAKKVTYKKGAKKYFSITIKNKSTGKAISGLTIKIKVYTGKKYKTYTVKTNSKGVAKLSTKALAKGTHKVVISSGNKNYSVSKSGNLIVIK